MSSPPERSNTTNDYIENQSPRSGIKIRNLRFLTGAGEIIHNPSRKCRPRTSFGTRRLIKKPRPKTTGTIGKGHHKYTEDIKGLKSSDEKEIADTEKTCRFFNNLIHQHWTNTVSLNQEIFNKVSHTVRKPQQQGHWVDRNGTLLSEANSIDVLESLIDFHSGDELYTTIDMKTSNSISRQLQYGDGIHVGINGSTPDSNRTRHNVHQADKREENENLVPLCWSDQITRSGIHIVKPRHPSFSTAQTKMNDTKPVLFERLKSDKWQRVVKPKDGKKTDGYAFKMHSKPRFGLNGEESVSLITNLTFEAPYKPSTEKEITIDNILEKSIPQKAPPEKKVAEKMTDKNKVPTEEVASVITTSSHDALSRPVSRISQPDISPRRPSIPYRLIDDDNEFDTLFITNSNPEDIEFTPCPSRIPSASIRRPVKSAHKSSVAQNVHNKRSYIQISTGIRPSKSPVKSRGPVGENLSKKAENDETAAHLEQTNKVLEIETKHQETAPDTMKNVAEQTPILPPSPRQEIKYTFNIPTADNLEYEADSSLDQRSVKSSSTLGPSVMKSTPSSYTAHAGAGSIDVSRDATPLSQMKDSDLDPNYIVDDFEHLST